MQRVQHDLAGSGMDLCEWRLGAAGSSADRAVRRQCSSACARSDSNTSAQPRRVLQRLHRQPAWQRMDLRERRLGAAGSSAERAVRRQCSGACAPSRARTRANIYTALFVRRL